MVSSGARRVSSRSADRAAAGLLVVVVFLTAVQGALGSGQASGVWQRERLPASLSAADLVGVSCTASTFCVTVGTSFPDQLPFAAHWTGNSWVVDPMAGPSVVLPPAGGYATLTAVSCASDTACTAVGSYEATGASEGNLLNAGMGRAGRFKVSPRHPRPAAILPQCHAPL
jgi:hypothetical protein